jgi:hypothetical protein
MTDTIEQDVRAARRQVAEVREAVRDYVSGRNEPQRRLRKIGRRAVYVGQDAGDAARRHPAVTGLMLVAVAAALAACYVQYETRD